MPRHFPPISRNPEHGRGSYELDVTDFMLSPQGMIDHLRATLTSPSYRPPLLPSVAIELMKVTRQAGVSIQEVTRLLEKDALLAARVLQLAQSALYARGAPIRSLHEAIARLGLRTLGDLFLQTVLSMRVFRADGYDRPMAELMRHSLVTAHVARLACRMTALPDEYAFMCGLLHDAGMAAGLLIFADTAGPGSSRQGSRGAAPAPPRYEEVAAALHAVHEEASALLADAWALTTDIRIVIGSHHRLREGGRIHPLAAVVCVSDWIASEAGARMGDESDPVQAESAARELSFTQANLDDLAAHARLIVEMA